MKLNFKTWFEVNYGDDIGFGKDGFWGNAGAGVLPISISSSRILVQKRSFQVEEPNTWGVFGGAVRHGYEMEQAAKEEFLEETGYRGSIKLIPAYLFKKGSFQYQNFLGLVQREFEPIDSWESSGHKWLTWDELESLPNKHFGLQALIIHSKNQIISLIK